MIDLIVVSGYFAFMLGVGWRARKGSPDSYWVAARRSRTFPVSASLVATIFGASSTVGIIGLGYSRGLTGAWWSLVGGLALIPFGLFLAAKVRRLGVYTLPDILDQAYGRKVSVAGAVVISLAWCGIVAAQLVAGALILESVLPLGLDLSLAVVTVVFVLYTLWGGQLSVIRTDSWQVFLFGGALLAALVLVVSAGALGGTRLSALPPGHLGFPTSPGFGWYHLLVFYPLVVGMPYLVGPDIYSRVLCAESEGSARSASLYAALAVIPLSLLLAVLGLLIHALFPGIAPEAALTTALAELAPVGVKGVIVIGVLGAIMSSADTTLISASTILSLNVLDPVFELGERGRLRLTRVLVVALGGLAWGIAAFQEGIISSLLVAYAVFVGGVALPTLASFWRDRLGVSPAGAFWAVVLGGSTAILGEVRGGSLVQSLIGSRAFGFLQRTLGPEHAAILPLIISALTLFLVSRMFPVRTEDARTDSR
ncbi:MAG: sodium:solute symporter family protein [Gemmatimonadetes bacterium]|nr:sodium:solute symporter family protein [Gemmatimonadota bacterium]NNM04843.1 sodium:solute symporter family protein [Gemmatimonadota bacterium]